MGKLNRSDGFSLAEVLFSVAIMFFVLTGIIGLMGVSSSMTVQAKQKTVLVNAVASEIDRLRGLPFDQLVSGSTQRDYSGVLVDVNMTVETKSAGGNEYYKLVRITATGEMQGETLSYSTSVVIRNPSNNMTLDSDPDAPTIAFTADAPTADEVFFAGERLGGGAIILKTRADSPSASLSEIRYQVAGTTLTQGNGSSAIFTPTSNPYYASPTWNTAAGSLADGFQTVTVTAVDSEQRTASVNRRFILDNTPALAPGIPSGIGLDSASVRLTWDAARDGGAGEDPAAWFWASQYQYSVYRQPLTGTTSPLTWPLAVQSTTPAAATVAEAILNKGPLSRDTSVTVSGPALTRASPPFSRFFVRVHSGRPRGIGESYADSTSLVVTRPELICDSSAQSTVAYGSKSGNRYATTPSLKVTKPNFPFTGTPVYSVRYRVPGGAWTAWPVTPITVTQNSGYVTLSSAAWSNGALVAYQFQVTITGITPSGYAGGTVLPAMETNIGKVTVAPAANTTRNLSADWGM
ncbi:MAG: hypothetical protein U1E26_05740 [Coriobacteriia bacterium]|nr:hypothetical protein [Coriobacteriia bacterium]